jgi:hypothetical protein
MNSQHLPKVVAEQEWWSGLSQRAKLPNANASPIRKVCQESALDALVE